MSIADFSLLFSAISQFHVTYNCSTGFHVQVFIVVIFGMDSVFVTIQSISLWSNDKFIRFYN